MTQALRLVVMGQGCVGLTRCERSKSASASTRAGSSAWPMATRSLRASPSKRWPPHLPKHEGLKASPVSPSAVGKFADEAYKLAWQQRFGSPKLAFRFFNVFGPLQAAGHAHAAVVPVIVSAAIDGRPMPVHDDGLPTRDFTSVGTVMVAITAAIERAIAHSDLVNPEFGRRSSPLDEIGELKTILRRSLEREDLLARPTDVRDSRPDNAAVVTLFPGLEQVSLRDRLTCTVSWFQATAR